MPQMANIVVKAANGTTDVTFAALTPSAGDSVKAQWRVEDTAKVPGVRPRLSALSRFNGPQSARRVEVSFTYPYVVTDAQGQQSVSDIIPVNTSFLVPQNVPDAVVDEVVALHANLINSALLKAVFKSGYAPT